MQAHVTVDEHSHTYTQVATTNTIKKYRILFIGPSFCPLFSLSFQCMNSIYTLAKNVYLKMQVAEKEFSLTWKCSNNNNNKKHLLLFKIDAQPQIENSDWGMGNSDWNHMLIIIFSNHFDEGSMECIIMQGLTRLCRRWLR